MRSWIGGLCLLGACGPGVDQPAPVTPDAIESSDGRPTAEARHPIGEGDAEAQRCFAKASNTGAAEAAGDAPCSKQAPASCARDCRTGDVDACEQLGHGFAGDDASCAAVSWRLACARDQLNACLWLGAHKRAAGDADGAATLWTKACDGGLPQACTAQGKALYEDSDTEGDRDPLKPLERACQLGDGEGCSLAGHIYDGINGGVGDRDKAAKLFERACKQGYSRGCVDLAIAYQFGRGVTADELEAQRLLDGVCRLDGDPHAGDACFQLAIMLGGGQSAHSGRARSLFERACKSDHFDACAEVARAHHSEGRHAEAIELSGKLIERAPDHFSPRFARGMSRFDTGLFKEAIEDLAVLCRVSPDWPHCQLWLFAARKRAGLDGKSELEAALDQIDAGRWPAPVFDLFLGKRTPQQLLAAAKDEDKQRQLEQECEAHYYIGQTQLFAGRTRDAAKSFGLAVATGISHFVEYDSAKAELARLPPP